MSRGGWWTDRRQVSPVREMPFLRRHVAAGWPSVFGGPRHRSSGRRLSKSQEAGHPFRRRRTRAPAPRSCVPSMSASVPSTDNKPYICPHVCTESPSKPAPGPERQPQAPPQPAPVPQPAGPPRPRVRPALSFLEAAPRGPSASWAPAQVASTGEPGWRVQREQGAVSLFHQEEAVWVFATFRPSRGEGTTRDRRAGSASCL